MGKANHSSVMGFQGNTTGHLRIHTRGKERGEDGREDWKAWIREGPGYFPACVGKPPTLPTGTMLQKALILSVWFFLAGNFPALCPELTADLDLTTDLEFTTDLELTTDRYLENTQAFKRSTDRESNTLNFVEEARGHS